MKDKKHSLEPENDVEAIEYLGKFQKGAVDLVNEYYSRRYKNGENIADVLKSLLEVYVDLLAYGTNYEVGEAAFLLS